MIWCDESNFCVQLPLCNETKETQVGSCNYNCENTAHKTLYDRVYHPLPENPTELNALTCGRFNRTGTLCGQCQHGYSPFVLSYNLSCVDCMSRWTLEMVEVHLSWVCSTYTLLLFFIVVFNINITSSRLHGVVLFSQAISMPALARILLLTFVTRPDFLQAVKVAFPLH